MALRKEPHRRYGSVEQFASDLRNYLTGMPVLARGNALRYRAGKFVRRRKVEIAAAAVVALSLIGGLWIAIREAQEAERQRLVAQRHFDGVRKMANTLLFDLHDEIAPLAGSTKAREMLVKTSLEYLNTLYAESSGDHTLQHELAVAYKKVGDIQGSELGSNTGDPKAALLSYARSVALLEPMVAADPENHQAGIALAQSYLYQGRLLLATSGAAAAAPVVQKAVVLSESLTDAFVDDRARLVQLAAVYSAQAHVLDYLERPDEVMAALDKLIGLCEAYAHAHPDDPQAYVSLTAAYNNAALVIDDRSPRAEALQRSIALLHKGMVADERLVAMQPDNARYHWGLAETRFNLGDALYANGDYAKAIEIFRQAAAVTRNGDSNDIRGQWTHSMVELGLAMSLVKVGSTDEAAILFTSAERFLLARASTGDSLRIEFSRAVLGIRRGEMYVALARNPRLSAADQRDYWQQARDSLRQGVEILRKVGESLALTGTDKELLDSGVAALAQAEAAIAGISAQ
ncbi:MAG TPA: tetratricopeptide repeat protein, partial [Povalibacter sp.]